MEERRFVEGCLGWVVTCGLSPRLCWFTPIGTRRTRGVVLPPRAPCLSPTLVSDGEALSAGPPRVGARRLGVDVRVERRRPVRSPPHRVRRRARQVVESHRGGPRGGARLHGCVKENDPPMVVCGAGLLVGTTRRNPGEPNPNRNPAARVSDVAVTHGRGVVPIGSTPTPTPRGKSVDRGGSRNKRSTPTQLPSHLIYSGHACGNPP